jgi:hypothetical protein
VRFAAFGRWGYSNRGSLSRPSSGVGLLLQEAVLTPTVARTGLFVRMSLAVGPMPWSAPEVLAGTCNSGVLATMAADIYQYGGTLHEIMTCGDAPFWWLFENAILLSQRRSRADPVPIPGTTFSVPGLRGKSSLQAAVVDSQPITWRVRLDGSEASAGRMQELIDIVGGCLEEDSDKRLKGSAL